MRLKSHIILLILFLLVFVCRVYADEYYSRHYIILVDQTKDLQVDDKSTFEKVYSYIRANLIGVGDSSFVFNEMTDEISLYTFALPGAYVRDSYPEDFNGTYRDIHNIARDGKSAAAYKLFVDKLIQNNSSYSTAWTITGKLSRHLSTFFVCWTK